MALPAFGIKNAITTGKTYRLTDGDGLYLLVTETGSKLWRFDFRYIGTRLTLYVGKWPAVDLSLAREKRAGALPANRTRGFLTPTFSSTQWQPV
jgi:Arm DNA-binding domain